MVTDSQVAELEAAGVDSPVIRQATTDTMMGLNRSLNYQATVMEQVAYRVGQIRGQKMLDEQAKVARRSKATWSSKAFTRKALAN